MNLFDNAKFLKIPELKKLDNELLNYIDYLYNEFPNLHFTDTEWINFINKKQCFKKMSQSLQGDIIKFEQTFACNKYVETHKGAILYIFIKFDLNRLNKLFEKLSIYKIYKILSDVLFIHNNSIFSNNKLIKQFKYLYSFSINYKQIYLDYIRIRIVDSIYSLVIPYILSKYSNHSIYNHISICLFLTDFYNCKIENEYKYYKNMDLYKIIILEYIEKMQPYAYELYDYFINKFNKVPNDQLLSYILNYNIKPINNESALKIIDFVKQKSIITNQLLQHIISSCTLTNKQVDELKAYHLLSNI